MRKFPPRDPPKRLRPKFVYIGAPACFALELACRQVVEAFPAPKGEHGGIYLVGSCLERPDWRDVDLRFMMSDPWFIKEFPDSHWPHSAQWEFDPHWLLLTTAVSAHLAKATGLPIDFQFQPSGHANKHHRGIRNPLGLHFARPPLEEK